MIMYVVSVGKWDWSKSDEFISRVLRMIKKYFANVLILIKLKVKWNKTIFLNRKNCTVHEDLKVWKFMKSFQACSGQKTQSFDMKVKMIKDETYSKNTEIIWMFSKKNYLSFEILIRDDSQSLCYINCFRLSLCLKAFIYAISFWWSCRKYLLNTARNGTKDKLFRRKNMIWTYEVGSLFDQLTRKPNGISDAFCFPVSMFHPCQKWKLISSFSSFSFSLSLSSLNFSLLSVFFSKSAYNKANKFSFKSDQTMRCQVNQKKALEVGKGYTKTDFPYLLNEHNYILNDFWMFVSKQQTLKLIMSKNGVLYFWCSFYSTHSRVRVFTFVELYLQNYCYLRSE